jgi:ABC-type transport system involved in multi-copper enzyme maturation permease subunit
MTATVTPRRAARPAGPTGPAVFGALVRAEWIKFRTVRGWVIGMASAVVVIALLGLFGAGSANIGCGGALGGPARTGAACLPAVATGPGGEAVVDSYYFVHQPLASQGSLTVRITSLTGKYFPAGGPGGSAQGPAGSAPQPAAVNGLQPWSKAGIMIAASTRPGAAYAAMMVTGRHGVRMQYDYTHDTGGLAGTVSGGSPRWLRLTRSGDLITGYDSADGTHWSEVGSASLAGLPSAAQVGLFATSPQYLQIANNELGGTTGSSGASQATADFGDVRLTGAAAGRGWAGQGIDTAADADYPVQGGGYRQAGGTFTVTGSGDIAPAVPGPDSTFPTATIEQHLVGVFAGLIAVVVVAAMFITAEYRRGLIRVTLAASPRRGQVLAAKAVVIGAVAFVVGLVAAAIVLPIGVRMSRGEGEYVMPVSLLTEVRVIVGTAALIAVAAVLALAIGAAMRRSAAAVTTAIVVIVLPYLLAVAQIVPPGAGDWVLRLTPTAGFAIQQSIPAYSQINAAYTPNAGFYPLAPWAGFAVLCGFAALALGVAGFLLRRRDA